MASKKKTAGKSSSTAANKGVATRKRNDLTKQLRADLKATKEALQAAKASARKEVKLAKAAAKAEVTVLKDQLNSVIRREKALLRVAEQKTIMMVKAAEQWEKQQLAKIQKMFKKVPKA